MILLRDVFRDLLQDGKVWHRMANEVDAKDVPAEQIPPRGSEVIQRGGTIAGQVDPRTGKRGPSQRIEKITGYKDSSGNTVYSRTPPAQKEATMEESTELRGLVAKTPNEEHANKIAEFLTQNKINARAADGAIFNPRNQTEQPSWGIYVSPGEVVDAGEILHRQSMAKGLSFDPYVRGGK